MLTKSLPIMDFEALRDVSGAPLLRKAIVEGGGVLLRGADISSAEAFERCFRKALPEATIMAYQGERASPRSQVSGGVYTSTEYDSDSSIFIHNEMSSRMSWPRFLCFACNLPAQTGGATPLCDIRQVTASLPDEITEPFAETGILYLRNYGSEFGVSIEYAFGTRDHGQIDDYCRNSGIACEWVAEDHLRTNFKRSAFVFHPDTGERLWFNYAMFYSLVSLNRRQRMMLKGVPEVDRPFGARYGNGKVVPDSVFEAIASAYEAATFRFEWRAGDMLVLDNMLLGHGRDPYVGDRRIWLLMADEVVRRSAMGEALFQAAKEPAHAFS